jgi:DNA invertase Pin-like site-specific DNA recombinase
MPIAYSYRRFSSEKQSTGDSLRRQTELADKYIERHPELGLELDRTIDLTDPGMSAYKGTHQRKGALGVFLRRVEDGLIEEGSYLLVESLDRLSRAQPSQALPSLIDLVNNGIVVVTLTDEKVYSKETISGTDGTFVLMQSLITMARAFEESETKGKRVRAAWKNKFNSIKNGVQLTKRTPFWITTDKQVKPAEADVVREIFELYAKGNGSYLIARKFNERGVRPPTSRSTHWSFSTINKILLSKTVLGILTTADGQEHLSYYPAIVTEELWNEVQRLRPSASRTAGRASVAPLSGIFKCATCGGTVKKAIKTGRVRKDGTRNRWETLICSRAVLNAGCVYIGLNHEKVLRSVIEALKALTWERPESDEIAQKIHELELAELGITDALQDAYDVFKATKTLDARERYESVVSIVNELRAELEQLREQSGSIPYGIQTQALQRIFSADIPTNSDLRKVIREGTIDFVKKEMTIVSHLRNVLRLSLDDEEWLGAHLTQ